MSHEFSEIKSEELMKILSEIDVSNIYCIRFSPKQSEPFNVMTENVKKLAIVIIEKLGKIEFTPHELDRVFEFAKVHLRDTVGINERKSIEDLIGQFVQEGGTISIIKKGGYFLHIITLVILQVIIIFCGIGILCGGLLGIFGLFMDPEYMLGYIFIFLTFILSIFMQLYIIKKMANKHTLSKRKIFFLAILIVYIIGQYIYGTHLIESSEILESIYKAIVYILKHSFM